VKSIILRAHLSQNFPSSLGNILSQLSEQGVFTLKNEFFILFDLNPLQFTFNYTDAQQKNYP